MAGTSGTRDRRPERARQDRSGSPDARGREAAAAHGKKDARREAVRDDCLIKQTRFAIIANIFTYYKKEPNAPRAGKNARIRR